MFRATLASAAVLAVLVISRAGVDAQQGKDLSQADQKFVVAADEIDRVEIRLGKMAQENSTNAAVKKLGERLEMDHKRMNKELRDIAQKQGITFPDKLDQKHQELVDQLSKMKGADFDRTYTQDMVTDHEKAIKTFEEQAQTGRDPQVKAWAAQNVKTLQEHLHLAHETLKDVGK